MKIKCEVCNGEGYFIDIQPISSKKTIKIKQMCLACGGKGTINYSGENDGKNNKE